MEIGLMNKLYRILALLAVLSIYGCATPPLAKFMIPDLPINLRHVNAGISVDNVKGGAENFAERYKLFIADDMHGPVFKEAIINTLNNSNIFTSVISGSNENYVLQPEILFQDTNFGIVGRGSFIYTLNAKYVILEKKTNNVVYANQFTTACAKTFSDSFGGAPRHRMAVECAVRDNLSQFIEDLTRQVIKFE